ALRSDCGPPPIPPTVPSSTSVFHSPQPSHLPAQRACTVPQFWQTNWKRGFAISTESRWASHAARAGSQWHRTGGTRGRGAAYSNLPSHIIPVIPPSEGCQQLVGNRACRLGHFVDRHVGAEEL